MFKTFLTLVRGRAYHRLDPTVDQHALTILDQQIRDCGNAIDKARKALAIAIAQDRQEQARIARIAAQIADLEERAAKALEAGHEDLGLEAAEAIAALETEHELGSSAQARFGKECDRLRSIVRDAEQRLRELERGRRSAKAQDAVLKLRDKGLIASECYQNTLADAEATVARLQARQDEIDQASAVLEEFDAEATPKTIKEKLANAGFGTPTRKRAEDVLERLRKRTGSNDDETPPAASPTGPHTS